MRLTIGIVLTLLGGVVVVVGLLGALNELVSLYSSALNDPLATDAPEGKVVGASMLRWAIVGAVGVPLLLFGVVLLKISLFQRLLKASRGPGVGRQFAPERGERQASHGHPVQPPRQKERGHESEVPSRPRSGSAPASPPRRDALGESGGSRSER